jgi:hypothetical protein
VTANSSESSAATATAPARSGLVLITLILVAAVANLNLAVANVALPDIGKAFDASQTELNLVAVGYCEHTARTSTSPRPRSISSADIPCSPLCWRKSPLEVSPRWGETSVRSVSRVLADNE